MINKKENKMKKYYELNNRDEYGCFGYSQEDVAGTFYYKDFRIQFFKPIKNYEGRMVSISAHPKNENQWHNANLKRTATLQDCYNYIDRCIANDKKKSEVAQ